MGELITSLLLFIPGIIACYALFKRVDLIERVIYSVILSVTLPVLFSVVTLRWLQLEEPTVNMVWGVFNLSLLCYLFFQRKFIKTSYHKDFPKIFLFSVFGVIWRIIFQIFMGKNDGDPYVYAGQFSGKEAPDLGIYTGMVVDHQIYGNIPSTDFLVQLGELPGSYFSSMCINLLYLGLIYLIFREYGKIKYALFACAIFALGPIEIFQNTIYLHQHSFAFAALFSFFLYYKKQTRELFIILLLIMFYTAHLIVKHHPCHKNVHKYAKVHKVIPVTLPLFYIGIFSSKAL